MQNTSPVHKLVVTVLGDDFAGYDSPLLGRHGISLLLEVYSSDQNANILFDVSQSSETILRNMGILGISPQCVDLIFLSHCHYDHTGGLFGMLKAIDKKDIPVIAHPTVFRPHYILEPRLRFIGVPRENNRHELENHAKFVLIDHSFSLMPGVISIPHGWGHDLEGVELDVAREHAGVNVNELGDPQTLEALTGNAVLNGIPVTLAPARQPAAV